MNLEHLESGLQSDVASIQQIPIISTLLDVICRTTGMGFAAVARVTDERWITCSLRDDINFGLAPGDELKVETTICHEIRQSGKAVIIDHVEKDDLYCNHHTPVQYGFQSYISVPIYRRDGSFFGTLCAIDPKPASLNNPTVIGMFNLFSDLISFHLNAVEEIRLGKLNLAKEREDRTRALEQKNAALQKMNAELESFTYVASHDLQEPLRKINTFSTLILNKDYANLSPNGRHYFDRLARSVKRMQTLIKDLITYTQVKEKEQVLELIPFNAIVEEVKHDFAEEIKEKSISIKVEGAYKAYIIPFQFKQLLQNIISNSIKFSNPAIKLIIEIRSAIEKGDHNLSGKLSPGKFYFHITVSDNGIGFDPKYAGQIFKIFQRLNGGEAYDGTGIGLSIVKKIVDNHHGFVTATAELDSGAKFDIYIPQPEENHVVLA